MSPTLKIGDHILVRKYSYGIRNPFTAKCIGWCKWPDRGDSIVFIFPEDRSKDFIQRVIAVAGDSVEIRTKKVLINGKAINDPHASFEESQTSSLGQQIRTTMAPRLYPPIISSSWETTETEVTTAGFGDSSIWMMLGAKPS